MNDRRVNTALARQTPRPANTMAALGIRLARVLPDPRVGFDVSSSPTRCTVDMKWVQFVDVGERSSMTAQQTIIDAPQRDPLSLSAWKPAGVELTADDIVTVTPFQGSWFILHKYTNCDQPGSSSSSPSESPSPSPSPSSSPSESPSASSSPESSSASPSESPSPSPSPSSPIDSPSPSPSSSSSSPSSSSRSSSRSSSPSSASPSPESSPYPSDSPGSSSSSPSSSSPSSSSRSSSPSSSPSSSARSSPSSSSSSSSATQIITGCCPQGLPATLMMTAVGSGSCSCLNNNTGSLTWSGTQYIGTIDSCIGTMEITLTCIENTWTMSVVGCAGMATLAFDPSASCDPLFQRWEIAGSFASPPQCCGSTEESFISDFFFLDITE